MLPAGGRGDAKTPMIWLLVLGLAAWVFMQGRELGVLKRAVARLEAQVRDLSAVRSAPVEAAANADEPASAIRTESPIRPWAAPREDQRQAEPAVLATPPLPEPLPPAPTPRGSPLRDRVSTWLEENGLAWAGGAALALGGLFLVTYAAQRGLLTPPMRIGAAMVVGTALLGVSEWLRRRANHPLAAAMAAGAGAATLYGAVWASYWLYGFIGLTPAATFMALTSAGLLALSFRHGEPLAMLALFGGFLAPVVTGPQQWSAPALTGFLAAMILTGFVIAAVRRWGGAGVVALTGAALWALAGIAVHDGVRVAGLVLAPAALALAALAWDRRRTEGPVTTSLSRRAFESLPAAALVTAALVLSYAWLGRLDGPWILAVGTGLGLLALFAALGDRRRLIPEPTAAVAYVACLGIVAVSAASGSAEARGAGEAAGGFLIAALVGSGVISGTARRSVKSRLCAALAGLCAVAIALWLSGPVTAGAPWAPELAAATILLLGAIIIAWGSDDAAKDLPLAIWLWASGGGALVGLAQGLDAQWLPLGCAGLALAAAAAHARLGWRGFSAVAVGAGVGTLAAILSPEVFDALGDRTMAWWEFAVVCAVAVGLIWLGARLSVRAGRAREGVDALTTLALIVALAGVGMLLRLAAAVPAAGGRLDVFMEAGLRTVLILVAGLAAVQAVRPDSSVIGRWRGQALLGLGLAHGLVLGVLALNPLWGDWKPAITGPPLLDSLSVSYLAPALLLAAATRDRVSLNKTLRRIFAAGAAGFLLVWALMETRRLFQGPSLYGGLDWVGRAEWAAYAVILLAFARAAIWLSDAALKRPLTVSTLKRDLQIVGQGAAWAALVFAVLVFGYVASPWWGPNDRPLAGPQATILLGLLYLGGALATFSISRLRGGVSPLARAARVTTVVIAFALVNLIARMSFHGYDLRPFAEDLSLETWSYSAVWGVFGFGLIVYGAARRSNDLRAAGLVVLMATLAKIFLFDMDRLDGFIRAASFLAVGALLLAAAVIIRRLGRGQALSLRVDSESQELTDRAGA